MCDREPLLFEEWCGRCDEYRPVSVRRPLPLIVSEPRLPYEGVATKEARAWPEPSSA